MPLNENAPRDKSLEEMYKAMRLFTHADYDGVTLDDYADVGQGVDDGNV